MTDTTVTPELLVVLARRMGLEPWTVKMAPRPGVVHVHYSGDGETQVFAPHTDPAQFGRMVVWAAQKGLEPMLAKRHAFAGLVGTSSDYTQPHNSTEAGIMAAATIAIALATGYEEPTHE